MPRQIGLIKLKGTMDDIVFSKTIDGYMAQKKRLFDPEKFKNDPNYLQARLNAQEFGIGGNASRVLREAFTAEVKKGSDQRMVSRLTQTMILALQADTGNEYGYRQPQLGDMTLLEKFDFNEGVPFSAAVRVPSVVTVNRATGAISVTLPAHKPQEFVSVPAKGVTHYRFFAAAATLDFTTGAASVGRIASANLPYDDNLGSEVSLPLTLPAASAQPIVVILGVEYMKVVNGKEFPNSKKENAVQIIAIDQAS